MLILIYLCTLLYTRSIQNKNESKEQTGVKPNGMHCNSYIILYIGLSQNLRNCSTQLKNTTRWFSIPCTVQYNNVQYNIKYIIVIIYKNIKN